MRFLINKNEMVPERHNNPNGLRLASLFPAQQQQRHRLLERRRADPIGVRVCGEEFTVFQGVYHTSVDTELMSRAVKVYPNDDFLEIGCGCGAVTLLLARRCHAGVGVDINPAAVENSAWNAERLMVNNATFLVSDVFQHVTGKFDVLVCNPPYNHHTADDPVERMFWDPNDEMKRKFFRSARHFLKDGGRIYFGWADFAELDGMLPLRLAEYAGFEYVRHFVCPARNGIQRFFVIELRPK